MWEAGTPVGRLVLFFVRFGARDGVVATNKSGKATRESACTYVADGSGYFARRAYQSLNVQNLDLSKGRYIMTVTCVLVCTI